MKENEAQIIALQERVKVLISQQNAFITELKAVREEVKQLKTGTATSVSEPKVYQKPPTTIKISQTPAPEPEPSRFEKALANIDVKTNFEEFIGENLIAKLGILITIFGVVIGAKYSIENELISPLTRIILGYLTGVILLGVGIKLKAKYKNYSAVLVSGAMAIMYFITFAAHSFYAIFPLEIAFGLMVLFTVFTVIAALNYDQSVIAHIGLVGAYGVPFFLSNESGNVLIFFSYITIINIGILAIAFRKYWKSLFYVAFGLTWLIFGVWLFDSYQEATQFKLALSFATVFFVLFYLTFLAYKLVRKESINRATVIILLLNSFIYYGICYGLLDEYEGGATYLGLFTLVNALVHFAVGMVIYKQKQYDRQLLFLVIGLVLIFITLAIPVQLDGNWVTMIWAAEAALLFWLGRTKQVPFYEKISYALMALGVLSILQDWETGYYVDYTYAVREDFKPLFNPYFLTSIVFVSAFAFINKIHRDPRYALPFKESTRWISILNVSLAAVFLIGFYMAFRMEIAAYFDQLFDATKVTVKRDNSESTYFQYNYDIYDFKEIWLFNYSLLFLAVLSFINLKKWKDARFGIINLAANEMLILLFLIVGLGCLNDLHYSYFSTSETTYFNKTIGHIGIRYLSYVFLSAIFWASFQYIEKMFSGKIYRIIFDLMLHLALLAIISSEFLAWKQAADITSSSYLGLSIIWGVYALLLIALGIWKKKKHLRVAAIVLFAVTLFKLFTFDIAHLSTISKTIVLVSLGVLLLLISFLYTKYKHLIFEKDEEEDKELHGGHTENH